MRDRAWRLVAAFVAGAAGAASFAPWPSATLQIGSVGAALLLAQRSHGDARWRAAIGFAYGMGLFAIGLSWLYISMHRYGGMPAPLAAAAVVLFAAYLSIFPAAAFAIGGATRQALDSPGTRVLGAARFAGAWALAEWLRGLLFTGFPWLASGYAHADAPLAGAAPVLGVYGVGLLAAFVAHATASLLRQMRATLSRSRPTMPASATQGSTTPASLTPSALGPLLAPLLAATVPFAAAAGLGTLEWARPHGAPISVRLVQGNVPQNLKFVPDEALRNMRGYARLASSAPADLTVLPETAWTIPWSATPAEIVRAMFSGDGPRGPVAIGMPLPVDAAQGTGRALDLANSVALIDAKAPHAVVARYDKRHLVPFGEFVPAGFRWFVDLMQIPLGDFARGSASQPPFVVRDQRLSFNVCYEDLFGEELIGALGGPEGASILVNVSNIAWFGESHALPQHLQIARMRSLETARPMLRATNTGMTAAIDHRGTVVASLRPFTVGVLTSEVQGTEGLTPYARWGNTATLAIALLLLAVGWAGRRSVARR